VVALGDAMIAGYTANPGVFPNANVAALQLVRDGYQGAKDAQLAALAQAQLATESKDGALDGLEVCMKMQLKQSEVDTDDNPEQLELIGWGPKAPAQPTDPPGQPRALESVNEGPGSLQLDWKGPARGTGGPVRTYIVQRREQAEGGGEFGGWAQISVALETEIALIAQPRNQQLEYRVIAINAGGESVPSNTVAVVL